MANNRLLPGSGAITETGARRALLPGAGAAKEGIASSSPVAFSGPVPNQSGNNGVAFSLNLAPFFGGTLTPFTYALQSGSLSGSGLSLSGGVISGTAATGSYTGLVVRATDTGTNTADTNTFSITITAGAGPKMFVVMMG